MATRITPSTLFKDLPFLSTHNSTLIDAQLCGTVSMELIERTLNMLEFFPICIELDVCKYSKQGALINTTFIDHYSKVFITFPKTNQDQNSHRKLYHEKIRHIRHLIQVTIKVYPKSIQ